MGCEASRIACIAAAPPARTTSSGSWPGGMQREAQRAAGAEEGQREVDQPLGGGEAGGVAVEGDDGLGRELPEHLELGLGDGGAERRDRVVDAGLGEGDHVHVALGDDDGAGLGGGGAGRADVVEGAALVEERRVGRVQVLRLLPRGDGAGAEGDAAAAGVADREDDAVAEAVVGLPPSCGQRRRARPRPACRGRSPCGQMVEERGAAVGRVADLEAVAGGRGEAAAVEVGARLGGAGGRELQAEELDRRLHRLGEALIRGGAGGGGGIALGHRHAGLGGEPLDGLDEAEVLGLAQEADGVALGVAAEAIVVALGLIHME